MDQRKLQLLALSSSLFGLGILAMVAEHLDTVTTTGSITLADAGRRVRVCGTITEHTISNNHVFLTILDETGSIEVVFFNTSALSLIEEGFDVYAFREEDHLCVRGMVDEFPPGTGKMELIYRHGI